jgi:hypothetical protein
MEVAIPIVLLGSMYVISNQDKKKTTNLEGYQNVQPVLNGKNQQIMGEDGKPMMDDIVEPVNKSHGRSVLFESSSYYKNPNAPVDKFYSPGLVREDSGVEFQSLTGETINSASLEHNNMVPFFGSKVKQDVYSEQNQSRLDNMIGNGSQHIKKQEIAPMFKPTENMQWAYGTPNSTDFVKSRMNPSMKMANVKPWEEVRVGPGLGKGQNDDITTGTGGFNSGMEFRDIYREKTVDELRYTNNPKTSYKGVLNPAKAHIQNRGQMGTMEKHLPDKYYVNSSDRYFTTKAAGAAEKPTIRSINLLKEQAREDTTRDYYGSGKADATTGYVKGKYMDPHRNVLDPYTKHSTNIHRTNGGIAHENQYGVAGFKNSVVSNNRTTTENQINESGVVAAFAKAAIAPLMDQLRPSRKMNVIGNMRPLGNAGVKTERIAYNPADRARTTIREMTEQRKDHLFVGNQQQYGNQAKADNYNPLPVHQNRDTTSTYYIGSGGSLAGQSREMAYDNAYNANMVDKEPLSRGRTPMGSNVKMMNNHVNIDVRKPESDRYVNNVMAPSTMGSTGPARQMYGTQTSTKQNSIYDNSSRNSADILNAFNSNPYTKPLNSVV